MVRKGRTSFNLLKVPLNLLRLSDGEKFPLQSALNGVGDVEARNAEELFEGLALLSPNRSRSWRVGIRPRSGGVRFVSTCCIASRIISESSRSRRTPRPFSSSSSAFASPHLHFSLRSNHLLFLLPSSPPSPQPHRPHYRPPVLHHPRLLLLPPLARLCPHPNLLNTLPSLLCLNSCQNSSTLSPRVASHAFASVQASHARSSSAPERPGKANTILGHEMRTEGPRRTSAVRIVRNSGGEMGGGGGAVGGKGGGGGGGAG